MTVRQRLTSNVYAPLGHIPINGISARDILDAMREVEARGALEVAKKTMAIIGQIMRYAVSAQYISADPTRDLRGALQRRVAGHFAAATTEQDAAVIVRAVRNYQGAMVVRLAMEFLMLTFVRPGNVRHARWEDIDRQKKVWRIPAEQMKMAKPHEVPLSRQALRVLEEIAPYSEGYELVFPALRDRRKPLSEPVFTTALRCAGIPKEMMSAHGFRSMASSLLNEAGEHPDLIEKQLAHVSGDKIRAVYNRAEYWKKRAELMQKYADMLDKLEKD
jgi:integrase